jgi:TP901 family phage tail tape measure protein
VAQANFDAEIRLDIGPFIASIQKAQAEVNKLSQQIDNLNKKTVSPTVSVGGGAAASISPSVGASSQERMAAAKQEIRAQEQLGEAQASRARQNQKDSQQQDKNLARERYALYDVAAAYTAVASAASLAVVATAGTAINFERAFVDVQRTTDFTSARIGAAAESAKNDLKSLAAEIPVAFGQITQIATIGNQLGIAQGSLTSFTETVAKFSATTGVSVESTAMSFGRIGELLQVPAQDFEKLGSAIAFAGVNAVATEEQILSVTKEIATTAKMAKFSSADIIGLSTALSSLGIAPEAARGSIIRTFAGINKVISEGGKGLEQYASIAGMSAEQFASTWQTNGQEAFSALLGGLQNLSDQGENLDTVLRNLGMVNVRDIQTIQKLGDNYDVYTASIREANQGFQEGAFLGEAYGQIQETVASKLLLVQNNIANLLDSLGQGAVGEVFKAILDSINDTLVALNQFAKTPVGQGIGVLVTIGGSLVAVIAAINAVSALASASLKAFETAQTALLQQTTETTVGLGAMNAQLGATGVAANTASAGLQKGQIALHALNTAFKAIKWFAIISAITHAISQMAIAFSSAEQKAESMLGGFSGLQDALTTDLQAYNAALNDLGGDVAGAEKATGVIAGLNTEIQNNNDEINKAARAQNVLNNLVGLGANNTRTLSEEVETLSFVVGANTRAWVANAIAQSESFQKLSGNTEAMQAIIDAGFNLDVALQAAASGNLDAYMDNISAKAMGSASAFEVFTNDMYNSGTAIGYLIALVPRLINELLGIFGIDLFPVSSGIEAIQNTTQGAINQMRIFGAQLDRVNNETSKSNADEYADQLKDIDESAAGAAKSLRTVVDYANDLRGIFSRAFEIRFGQQESLDQIASGWNNIKDKAAGATDAISKANDEIKELTADRSILEYQLTVAERYGDEQRAAVIRAKIAKIDSNVADKKEDIKKATENLSKSTEGSTDTAIENRKVLVQQVEGYAALVEMYSKTGLKGRELRAKVKELKEEFIQQGIQAGFSREQLAPYAKAFDDMRQTINKTPRNVDVEFKSNISAAMQAVNEYLAKLNKANGTFTSKINVVLPQPGTLKMIIDPSDLRLYRMAANLPSSHKGHLTQAQFYKAVYGIDLRNFAMGGFVSGPGTGTSDSIPAMLSNGEYVIKASAVGAYGVDFLNALNQQKVGSFNSTSSAASSGSASTVAYLSPEDRSLLRAVIDRPVNLYTENAKIASSANAGNVVLAQRGTN